MTDFHISDKWTKSERAEHVTRIKAMAREIADALDAGTELPDTQRDLARLILSESVGGKGNAAATIRAWADGYYPKRSRGQAPLYSHVEAAKVYVVERMDGRTHYKTIQILVAIYGANATALERVIWPLLPNVCAYIGADIAAVMWRDTPPK